MTTQIRCWARDCGNFFEKKLGECPECGAPIRGKNKYLEKTKLNDALYKQAEYAND
jgi:rRNA maturation endonuclease Nob1